MSCSELLGHLKQFFKKVSFFSPFRLKVLSSIKPVTDIQSRVPNNGIIGIKLHFSVAHLQKLKPIHLVYDTNSYSCILEFHM